MLEGFICPDKETVLVEDCLKRCRMEADCPQCGGTGCPYCKGTGKIVERCLTLPALKLISHEREWNGVASTTQLLNGTMLEFLKLTKPYYIDPDSRAFLLAGTRHHTALEVVAKGLNLPAEIPLSVDRDVFDLIEVEEEGLVLTDYKLWGSFRVAKALGVVEAGKIPDPSGAVYKSSGKWGKAGDPKMVSWFRQDPDKADNWEAELQLNRYRIMLEDLGLKIYRMQLQVTVRDGGLFISEQRGIFRNTYRIPIQRLPDTWVVGFFHTQAERLALALDQNSWSTPCSEKESWDGIRCKNFCDVANYCPKGQLIKSLEGG